MKDPMDPFDPWGLAVRYLLYSLYRITAASALDVFFKGLMFLPSPLIIPSETIFRILSFAYRAINLLSSNWFQFAAIAPIHFLAVHTSFY